MDFMDITDRNIKIDPFSDDNRGTDLGKRTVKSGAIVMASEIFSAVMRLIATAILARILFPEDFGLLAMVTAITMFAERFKDIGLGDATVQSKEINHEEISSLFWINICVCLVLTVILSLLSSPIAWFYQDERLENITIVIASTFIFSGLVIQHQALLRRKLRFGALAFIQFYSVFVSLVVAVLFAYLGFGYWALVAKEFIRALLVVIGTWVACPWRPSLPGKMNNLGKYISMGKDITGFNLLHFFSRSIDRIIIGKLFGPLWAGLYANAYQLVTLPVNQIQYPVNTVAFPTLSTLQGDQKVFRSYFEKMIQLLTFITMPAVMFVAIFADIIVGLLLGPRWNDSIPILRIVAIGVFVEPIIHASGPAIVAVGKTKVYFKMGLINSIIMISCLIVGSSAGASGVALGYSISIYLSLIVCLGYGLKDTAIIVKDLLKKIAVVVIINIVTATMLLLFRIFMGWNLNEWWLIVFAAVSLVLYLGIWMCMPGGRLILRTYKDYANSIIVLSK